MPRYLPLICLAMMHMLVDACAILVGPIWADLNESLHMSGGTLFLVLSVAGLSPAVSQVAFGYLRDRCSARFLLWLGPVVAAGCLSLVGVASNVTVLCVLLIVGGAGVGAFHPEAAVAAGRMLPGQRARGLSLFMFGGALGLGLGPILSGAVVGRFGLAGLVAVGPPIALLVGILFVVGQRGLQPETAPATKTPALSVWEMLEGRIGLALLVLAACSLRLVPNMAMDKVLSFTLAQQGADPFTIGLMQSIFLISASVGMLVMAFRFRSGWEKRFLVWCPVAGMPLLYFLGQESCPRWLLLSLLVPAGVILWGTTPVMVSYAHQQFPKGTGLASALTMGLSWGVGGMIQAKLTSYYVDLGIPQQAFHAFIPCLALAAVGAWLLPDTAKERAVEAEMSHPDQLQEVRATPADL
jgi:MFS transporter, FSR family, fosmidomycin resistance protein